MQLVRIASHVHATLSQNPHESAYSAKLDRLLVQTGAIARLARRLRICRARRWTATEAREQGILRRRLSDLDLAIRRLANDLELRGTPLPSPRTVYDDIRELEEEFGEVRLEAEDGCLSVATEPIVLEGVELGPFELRLNLDDLARGDASDALRAVALVPHPCATNDAVTHPHVSDERVCLGEGMAAFRGAAEAGRLADALQIARAVLRTYSSASPYCSLDAWDGRPCADCGCVCTDTENHWCERCAQDFCGECFTNCACCGSASCVGCLYTCPHCDERICSDCRSACRDCGRPACDLCTDDGVCLVCLEEPEQEKMDDEPIQVQIGGAEGGDTKEGEQLHDTPAVVAA